MQVDRLGAQKTGNCARLPDAPDGFSSLAVLVADDCEIDRLSIEDSIRSIGHRAESVSNGTDAADAVCARRFDLVLMDLCMPGVDGHEAARRIRASGRSVGAIPIVAITARPRGASGTDPGVAFDGLLHKPIDATMLRELFLTLAERNATRGAVVSCPPALDRDVIARVCAAVGPKGLENLLAMFETDARSRPSIICALSRIDHRDLVRFECASLRGACMMIGARRLAEACEAIEQHIGEEDFDALVATDALAAMAEKTLTAIDIWRAEMAAALPCQGACVDPA